MRRLTPVELGSYDHVPPEVAARVLVQKVPVLPPGSDGMTLGRLVLVKRDDLSDRTGRRKLLAHELVHVRQFAEQGRARFVGRYLLAYLRNLARLRRHRLAYLAIPFEVEARAGADGWEEALGRGREG